MKPHMSMCQRINVPQNMYRSVNHRMDMEAKTANPFQNKNVTRFAQSGTIDQNYAHFNIHGKVLIIPAIPFHKKHSYKKRPIKFFNHKKPRPIKFSVIRNKFSY